MSKFRTFEECYDEINKIVEDKRDQWTFKASVMRDFDDVKSEIITHIWKKWHLYNQEKPLGGWVATITKHQLSNILRDTYLSTSSPCGRCPCNRGDKLCTIYGEQGIDCALYKKWYFGRRHSHEARLPVSIEERYNEVIQRPDAMIDIEKAVNDFHPKMQAALTDSEWEIYRRLYIEFKEEEKVAQELGFKTSEQGRKMGYKRIQQVKAIIFQKARKIANEEGVETL